MCELFAMSASAPVRVRYDLDNFAAEGGERHQNRDGWGIVITEGNDAHYFREAAPASDSPLDRFIRNHTTPHAHVIAHMRRASSGMRALENTHLFRRVRAGRAQHFAHNGTLDGIENRSDVTRLLGKRLGDTDSELAFFLLLDRLEQAGVDPFNVSAKFEIFRSFCKDMASHGSANLLWLDAETLYVHADQRVHETPDGLTPPKPPGQHILRPEPGTLAADYDLAGASVTELPDHIVLFASVPLNDAAWEPLPQGAVVAVEAGRVVRQEERT